MRLPHRRIGTACIHVAISRCARHRRSCGILSSLNLTLLCPFDGVVEVVDAVEQHATVESPSVIDLGAHVLDSIFIGLDTRHVGQETAIA